MDKLLQKVHEHASNGMNCLMPVQAFAHQAFHSRLRGDLITQRYLVFDDNVNCCVNLLVRQLHTGFAMIL